jgi:hypothetical protein
VSRHRLPFALAAALAVALAGAASAAVLVSLTRPLPATVTVGRTLTVTATVSARAPRTQVVLQTRRGHSWTTVASKPAAHRVHLRWRVGRRTEPGFAQVRVAVLRAGRVLASTKPATIAIAAAPILCARPVPPAVNIPAGDGWIEGGLYVEGGPFPGIDDCEKIAYTIVATAADGSVAATQPVAAGHSYTLVVPAGAYTLTITDSEGPRACGDGQATVTPGRLTRADAVCAIP